MTEQPVSLQETLKRVVEAEKQPVKSQEEKNPVVVPYPIEVYVPYRFDITQRLPIVYASVPCEVHVSGCATKNEYDPIFYVEVIPRHVTLPKDFPVMALSISTVTYLDEYLKTRQTHYSSEELFQWASDEEEDELIVQLPYPFNQTDCEVELEWRFRQDITFDENAENIWQAFFHKYTEQELNEEDVETLKLIARTKEIHVSGKKLELIERILSKQKNVKCPLNIHPSNSGVSDECNECGYQRKTFDAYLKENVLNCGLDPEMANNNLPNEEQPKQNFTVDIMKVYGKACSTFGALNCKKGCPDSLRKACQSVAETRKRVVQQELFTEIRPTVETKTQESAELPKWEDPDTTEAEEENCEETDEDEEEKPKRKPHREEEDPEVKNFPKADPSIMLEKDFFLGKDGWSIIANDAWISLPCLHCGKYYSTSFSFIPEKDKTEYITTCHWCNVKLKVKIPLELNNKLFAQNEAFNKRVDDSCQRKQYAKKHGYTYLIEITAVPFNVENEEYNKKCFCCLDMDVLSGGGYGGYQNSKEQCLENIRDQIKEWNTNAFPPDKPIIKVTDKTLFFYSFTPEITKAQVLNAGQVVFGVPTATAKAIIEQPQATTQEVEAKPTMPTQPIALYNPFAQAKTP
ncbi:MAG: hypothetical protein WC325_11715, partial [Candidatus Bathyarchaeia archaeon]